MEGLSQGSHYSTVVPKKYFQGDHSPHNVKFPDNSPTVRDPPAHVKCQSLLVLLSVVGVGMQQCTNRNQDEMHKLSKSRMDTNMQI